MFEHNYLYEKPIINFESQKLISIYMKSGKITSVFCCSKYEQGDEKCVDIGSNSIYWYL